MDSASSLRSAKAVGQLDGIGFLDGRVSFSDALCEQAKDHVMDNAWRRESNGKRWGRPCDKLHSAAGSRAFRPSATHAKLLVHQDLFF